MDEMTFENNRISAVIICFNEEKTITSTLDSLKDLVDEIIIVDTGSTDNTIKLISQHPSRAKLYSRPWNNDFSEMRNYAISLASCTWCLVIDADEYIAEETRTIFRDTIQKIIQEDRDALYAPLIDNLNGSQLINNARIFRKRPSLRYHGKVHEYLDEEASKIIFLPIIKILHYGYVNNAYEEKSKHTRNKKLLDEQIILEPDGLRWKYFSLRYLKPEDPEHEKILQHFGALPLPYDDDWEVYAYNIKSKLIISLLEKRNFQQAWQQAKALYEYYKDKDTCLLYLLTNYLRAQNLFLTAVQESANLLRGIESLHTDEYLTEKLNIDSFQNVLDELALYMEKNETKSDPAP
ncbi:glycosyltransferase family 2 protein [Enterobacteriaceae bacterium H20N1]|uniref:Glycosyltransferase family 2 protein n=1 Tax=Dryocola boscaweniae TaxID=2925397 RepID=A0A9X3AQB8_9ENTR|nr:glycosyltransferase family 2 protein [Dryocola boscaweniae]MCT4702545.1 glycosyltransferase family 2 protein [Dryocola boscaweniae]MCT4719713.1 glycosyltransferase family 2 protein [Dryocola boscaweniae]